ncbi:hypothetical protein [Litchfieldia salsa]|uniref:DUF1440 domain-containing protein n=1 Tax=Litchfieldia salsa TaxID=930152 RepID=A0A1H0PE52_9BACI|nr:hypothetical protein [Litchfieldia salsa]SDP03030.1 hypothetical protein SAMN05216565_101268 [Litchfieldia salsa]
MKRNHLIYKGIVIGTISGIILGLFLKLIETLFGVKVYTLLLNVDYIPLLKDFTLSELIEFILHLIISLILAVVILFIIRFYDWNNCQIVVRVTVISLIIGIALYPTTALSSRTPELTSIPAIFFWLIGHVLYGLVLSGLIVIKRERRRLN